MLLNLFVPSIRGSGVLAFPGQNAGCRCDELWCPANVPCHTQRVTASYSFKAGLWLYPGEAGWHFLTLPVNVADDIRARTAGHSKAFGSVKVTAEIAGQAWQTSLFADTKTGTYLLPVKKDIRDKAMISAGDEVAVHLSLHNL
ncbi:hypothetical protein C3B78_18290 [Arthrobacter sp. PGP41]|nr:hypothetical protein C3B78_18290 [Arthrobacter sp. PGP41]